MRASGIALTDGEDAGAVFVAHLQDVALAEVERAARAITSRAAPLFTSSYVRGYAGANGIIFSRGAMITAAIAKVSGRRGRACWASRHGRRSRRFRSGSACAPPRSR